MLPCNSPDEPSIPLKCCRYSRGFDYLPVASRQMTRCGFGEPFRSVSAIWFGIGCKSYLNCCVSSEDQTVGKVACSLLPGRRKPQNARAPMPSTQRSLRSEILCHRTTLAATPEASTATPGATLFSPLLASGPRLSPRKLAPDCPSLMSGLAASRNLAGSELELGRKRVGT